MTTKKSISKTDVAPILPPLVGAVAVADTRPISDEEFNARMITGGDFAGSAVVNSYLESTATDHCTLLQTLQLQGQAIHQGDLRQVESMLIGQAVALQSMFVHFALRAKKADSLQTVQCLAQLALRAQAGSRSTLQALAEVKNPRQVAFVKQTNVAQTQQVNNGVMTPSALPMSMPSHTETTNVAPIELLAKGKTPHGCTKMDA